MTVFSVDDNSGDIESLLGRVGDAVRRWEGGDILSLDLTLRQGQTDRLLQRARQLRLQQGIDGNAIIVSTRPGLGPWIIRFQHLVRRVTWWFTEPVLQQVRAFQLNAARVIEGLAENQEGLLARASQGSDAPSLEQVEQLEQRIRELEARVEALTTPHDT